MPPQFLYFDLGNVLMTFDHDRMCRQMAEVAGVAVEAVRAALFPANDEPGVQWRFEEGTLSEDAYYEHLCQTLGVAPPREALELAASDIFGAIDPTHELVERLAADGWRLGLLSNTNLWHWRLLMDGRFPTLNRVFEVEVTSFDAQSMKPDRRIYDLAAERAGCRHEELFFVDDRADNIAGARAVGIDAVRFTTPEQLKADLAERGAC